MVWQNFINILYETDWCPFVKETFNGFGNAIDYLGRYTHRIAISNRRLLSVTQSHTTFWYHDHKDGNKRKEMTLDNTEFIRRFLMHVLPKGYRKIRYYRFLNNRFKKKNLRLLFSMQERAAYQSHFTKDSPVSQILKDIWNIDLCKCPKCGGSNLRDLGKRISRRC